MITEPLAVTLLVAEVLESLGVSYLIGGSLASAVHGVVRATLDSDLVAELQPSHVAPFAAALGSEFYVDPEAMLEAIEHRASFNIIHRETMFKVDVFISRKRPFDQAQFQRRVAQIVAQNPTRTAYIASAEDTVLAKLEWYRAGGEVSERQWGDVLGVLQVQLHTLDLVYLRRWAKDLGVADLLERAWQELPSH